MLGDMLLIALAWAVVLVGVLGASEDFFDPFVLFTAISVPRFILRPMFILLDLDRLAMPHHVYEDPAALARTVLVIFIIGYAGFLAGWLQRGRIAAAFAAVLPGSGDTSINQMRLRRLVIGGLGITIATLLVAIAQLGSIARFIFEVRRGFFSGVAVLSKIPLVTSYLAVLLVVLGRWKGNLRKLDVALFIGSLMTIALFGDRGGVVYALIALVIGYHFSIRRIRASRAAGLAVTVVLLLFSLGVARQVIWSHALNQEVTTEDLREEFTAAALSDHLNLKVVDYLMIVIQDFDRGPKHEGRDFVVGMLGVIPRSIWEGKPRNIYLGGWFRDRYAPGTGGKPITGIGEWWLNFGVAGVFLGCLLGGYISRGLWTYVQTAGNPPWASVVYAILFLNVTGWGVISSSTPTQVVFWVIPMIMVYWLVRESTDRPMGLGEERKQEV